MALTIIVTNAGRAALVNAANTGTAPVTIAQVGLSGAALVPSPSAVALPGEFKRLATLSGDVIADDTIHMIVRDEGLDVFTVRSLALYLADGTLFAIYGQADVLVEKSSQSMLLLAIDVRFEDVDATDLTFGDANFLNPPATTEQQGVIEIATTAEAQAGIDALRALTPAAAKAAILGWLLAQDGAGSGLDADLLDGKEASAFGLLDGSTTFTGPLRAIASNQALFKKDSSSNPTVIHRMDGSNYYILLSDPGTGISQTYNALRPFRIDAVTGLFASANGQSFSGGMTVTGSMTLNGEGVWTSGNDGSGSGLDADLLDGQDGSYYTDIVARLGFTPLNKAGDTLSGRLALSGAGLHVATKDDITGRVNSGFWQTSTASIAEGWPLDSNNWFHLITSTHSSELNYYSMQFAGNFYNSSDLFYRATGNNGAAAWNRIWNSANDGAGSGLDADLLDGADASWFANIPARLGYTPVNRAGDTMSGNLSVPALIVPGGAGTNGLSGGNGDGASYSTYNLVMNVHWGLGIKIYDGTVNGFYDARAGRWDVKAGYRVNGVDVWHPGNDGSGSGLDADLLDGADASWFANIPARLGFTPLQQGGGAGQGANKIYIGWSGSRLKAHVDSVDLGNLVFDGHIADVWRSSNDGSGSGLDADLLDGFQADAFLRDIGNSMAEQGYLKLSNGLIIQWGTAAGSYSANVNVQVNFPVAFPNQVLHVGGGNGDVQAQGSAVVGINYTGASAPDTARFFFRTNVAGQNRCNWIAIGR